MDNSTFLDPDYPTNGFTPDSDSDESPEPAADWWNPVEKLKKLKITAPPDWNEYDAYLLNGGTLEYEEWRTSSAADLDAMLQNADSDIVSALAGDLEAEWP